jgi:hypothetical protein
LQQRVGDVPVEDDRAVDRLGRVERRAGGQRAEVQGVGGRVALGPGAIVEDQVVAPGGDGAGDVVPLGPLGRDLGDVGRLRGGRGAQGIEQVAVALGDDQDLGLPRAGDQGEGAVVRRQGVGDVEADLPLGGARRRAGRT